MGLDYGHTCPDIDAHIKDVKGTIKDYLYDIIIEAIPIAKPEEVTRIAESNVDYIYRDIEHLFEGVRKTNEELRKAAEKQIDKLEDENWDLQTEIKRLEEQIEDYQEQLRDAEKELNALSV